MLSDYKEIVNNWNLALHSQGFTEEQIKGQMDTIARKYQTLKTEITGMIMNTGNGGLTSFLKEILDGTGKLIRVLNGLNPAVWNTITSIGKLALAIYAARKAIVAWNMATKSVYFNTIATGAAQAVAGVNSLSGAFRALKTAGVTSLAAIKGAMVTTGVGAAFILLGEGISYAIDKFDKANNAAQLANQKMQEEYQQTAQRYEMYERQAAYVQTLCNAYGTLRNAVNDTNLTEEKRKQLVSDISFTEEKLRVVLGNSAVERIKNSSDVALAAQQEADAYSKSREDMRAKLRAWMTMEEAKAVAEADEAMRAIERYNADAQAFINGADAKIDALDALGKARLAYAKLEESLDEVGLTVLQHKLKKAQERGKNAADSYYVQQSMGASEETLKKLADTIMEAGKEEAHLRQLIIEKEATIKKNRNDTYYNLFGSELEEARAKLNNINNIAPNDMTPGESFRRATGLGGDEAPVEEPGKSAGSGSRQNNMQDPRILSHVSRIDEIASNTSNQVSLLNDIKSQQGNSKELSIQTFDTYQRGIDELKAERQRLNDTLYESNVNAFNGQFSATISDTAASDAVINAAESYLGQTMANGVEGCVEAVTKIGSGISSFLAKELENGVVYVPSLVSDAENAGISVVPYDANNVGAGDVIVYGNEDHVVMADGKGGYVGNSSSLNQVVHGSDYTAMGDLVPTKIIKTGTIAGDMKASWNDSLANYAMDNEGRMFTSEVWNQGGLSGQIKLVEQALQVKGQENNEFLMELSKVLLAGLKSLNDADAKIRSFVSQQANQWFTDMNAEVSQAGTTASQQGNRDLFMLGSGATEYDKARIELQKNTAELKTMGEIVEREQTKALKDTVAGKAFLDSYLQKQMSQRDLQFKTVVAMYNDAKATADHNVKMRDYGYNGVEDRMGDKRATDALADAMVQVELQRKQLELARTADEKNYQEIRKMEESYKDALEALRTAQRKYNQQVLDGFEQIAEDFMFNGKSFRDIIDNLWQDLGKDALRALFGQDISENHSFLATLLGIGKPDEEQAKAQAQEELKNVPLINATDRNTQAVNQLTQAILGQSYIPLTTSKYTFDATRNAYESARPFSLQENAWNNAVATTGFGSQPTYDFEADMKQWKQSSDYLNRTMMQSNKLNATGNTEQKRGNDALGKNTNANLQVATGLMGIGNAFANGDWLGGLLGIAQMGMGFGWWKTGGKFADGGAPAGKVTGAGTGRSDSILAYLANKDKFVWLSNGEYVINEKSAKALGYDTLDALNGYATGGSLDSSPTNPVPYIPTINPQVAKKATRISGNSATEALLRKQNKYMAEQNSMLKNMGESGNGQVIVLNTQASSADVMKALQENPRAIQAILGRQQRMGFR